MIKNRSMESRYRELLDKSRWDFKLPQQRYGGIGLDWSINHLADADIIAIKTLYTHMSSLMNLSIWDHDDHVVQRSTLVQWAIDHQWKSCWRDVAAIGPETYAQIGPNPTLRRVIHDLRGGPMTSLVLAMSLIDRKRKIDPQYICLLARDVRKITRNCFPDIDPDRYHKDQQLKKHSVRLISEKWSKAKYHGNINVYLGFEGYIANSCVEFSAVDRTLYNVMNNALRESATDESPIELYVLTPEGSLHPEHVLFWVENVITQEQADALIHRFGDDYADLFLTNYSTTGSGVGLQIVADFVSKAYGVTAKRAFNMGILGVERTHQTFAVWFYWPAAD